MLINEFYANREVFATGCTGYLGKALLEKLLRDCPKIKVFYVLLRAKKSLSAGERLEQLKQDKVFHRIREQCPEVLKKLHAIQGNTEQLGLGIQASDLKLLRNVSIIFHMAANVKFDDPLRSSILINTRGTHEVIKIAQTLKNLVAFMHCSTAYCNPFEDIVKEKVYKIPVDWRQAIKIAETYDEYTLNCLFYKYTGFYPNSYCFTKNLSEQLIKEYSATLPISLFRPSVVMNAHREPEAGWIDNLNGPIAGMVAMSVGILPVGYIGRNVKLDAVPVDFVTKLTIVATYKRGMMFLRKEAVPNDLEVINCASGDIYDVCMRAVAGIFYSAERKNPMENKIWDYNIPKITACYYDYLLQMFLTAIPLAIVLDLVLRAISHKPILVKMVRRTLYAVQATLFFTSTPFKIINDNMINLEKSIPESEVAIYGVQNDMNVNFAEYFDEFTRGVKYYLFNQPKEATVAAQRRAKILFVVNRSIKFLIVSFFILYLWSKVKTLF